VNGRQLLVSAIASAMLLSASAGATAAPPAWDGLVQVKSKHFDLVYLQPGADFRGYTKVMIDPTEVAFRKNWQRDYNRDSRALSSRVTDSDVQDALTQGVRAATDIFTQAWTKGGYAVVDAPGPDVIRVRTGVVNISVNAPDKPTAGRAYSFSPEAGQATLFVEARDSMTGALLGRAIDQRIVGDTMTAWRTSSSNRADFRDQVEQWATASVRGVAALKASSPINSSSDKKE
jgi:hypothetical protein